MANPAELIAHVKDAEEFHLPLGVRWLVPQPFEALGIPFHMTKFMWLEVLAAVLMVLIFVPVARKIRTGAAPRGRLWNMFEVMLLFIRDQVARPAIGHHDADRFLPMLWNLFFFITLLNLFGLLPWAGSPTTALGATLALAAIAFAMVAGAGIGRFGVIGFLKNQVPHMDVPLAIGIFLKPMLFVIELLGLVVKHFVLAMRLFANMFGGHLVLAVVIGFIAETAASLLWYGVAPISIFGAVALSLLEFGIAFLQAYIFTFLTALFIGMAVHQH